MVRNIPRPQIGQTLLLTNSVNRLCEIAWRVVSANSNTVVYSSADSSKLASIDWSELRGHIVNGIIHVR